MLIPSCFLRHSNTAVPTGETRQSFTEFSAGGLFRYKDDEMRTRVSMSNEERKRKETEARESSWGAWNRAAADVFVEYFMNLQKHEQFDGGSVKKAFQTHLKQLKKNYDRRPNAKDIKARRAGRVRRTFERRMNAIDVFQTQYPNDKDMKRIARASSYITMEASGEESCEEGVLTTKLPWRSRELEDFLHRCSDLHLSVKYNQNKSYKNGAFPARRFPSDKIDSREQAPAGLPLNFYNDAWLNNANHPNRRASMKPKPAINLALPEFVLRLGKRFEHVNTRADVPLPPDAV
ncbi:hypothetical protein K435DRAFT_853518 [Dendrothele bispora CBS 962.96]|uniref:Uncharacterized protein n=1 Tax=Dendrothele bispora (strain CBS 962.96) TaxID=1314807 RepID=A0A4S8MHA7_DENBC|nr:hypothetical protein K435DRAFT_853518 [Dendrothele bispora CBS 962.96]